MKTAGQAVETDRAGGGKFAPCLPAAFNEFTGAQATHVVLRWPFWGLVHSTEDQAGRLSMRAVDLEVLTTLLHQVQGYLASAGAKRAANLLLHEIAQIRNQDRPDEGKAKLQETLELLLDVAEDAEDMTECDCPGEQCAGTCTHYLATAAQLKAKELLVALYRQEGQAGNELT